LIFDVYMLIIISYRLAVNTSDIIVASMAQTSEEPRVAPGSHGDVLALISDGSAATTADLSRITGLARSTISQRVRELGDHRYLIESQETPGATAVIGRPARRIRLRTADNLVFAIDLGVSHCRMALMDISRTVLDEREIALAARQARREVILPAIEDNLREMLHLAGKREAALRAIGMGVPAPIEYATGKPSNPPILGPGWNGYPLPAFFKERFGSNVAVLVDNDVNVMALGEHRTQRQNARDLMLVKVGTGIGCGTIVGGRLHRGAQGCAGDIGHIQVDEDDTYLCHCGKTGCLEAVASGSALARALSQAGHHADSPADVMQLSADGNSDALRAVREAGQRIGRVLAALVNFFNPEVITVGGVLAQSHHLIAGIRDVVNQRSLALALSDLRIEPALASARAGVLGAGILAIEHILDPARVNREFTAK
jgi:predicted NBD/HSP70 family sugar kinase